MTRTELVDLFIARGHNRRDADARAREFEAVEAERQRREVSRPRANALSPASKAAFRAEAMKKYGPKNPADDEVDEDDPADDKKVAAPAATTPAPPPPLPVFDARDHTVLGDDVKHRLYQTFPGIDLTGISFRDDLPVRRALHPALAARDAELLAAARAADAAKLKALTEGETRSAMTATKEEAAAMAAEVTGGGDWHRDGGFRDHGRPLDPPAAPPTAAQIQRDAAEEARRLIAQSRATGTRLDARSMKPEVFRAVRQQLGLDTESWPPTAA